MHLGSYHACPTNDMERMNNAEALLSLWEATGLEPGIVRPADLIKVRGGRARAAAAWH